MGLEDCACDSGLFITIFYGVELPEWCALEAVAAWAPPSMRPMVPELQRRTLAAREACCTPWDFCRRGDVTGLWSWWHLEAPHDISARILQDVDDETFLHVALASARSAAARGHLASHVLSWLLSRPNVLDMVRARNKLGRTALHDCAERGLFKAAHRILKVKGVEVDATDIYTVTPLLQAVREEHLGVVSLLLAAQANVNTFVANCHGHGDTPLILAVRLKNVELVRRLLATPGIDLHQQSMEGCTFGSTALDFAASHEAIRNMITEAIAARGISKPPLRQECVGGCNADCNDENMHVKGCCQEHPLKAFLRKALGFELKCIAGIARTFSIKLDARVDMHTHGCSG